MLKLLKKETHTPQTERIYKVPLCIQDTIPIYRIAENGIFELEKPDRTLGSKREYTSLTGCICLRILIFQHRMKKKRKIPAPSLKRFCVP